MMYKYKKTSYTPVDRVSFCNEVAIDNPTESYIRYPLPLGVFRNYQRKILPMKTPVGPLFALGVMYSHPSYINSEQLEL